MKKFVCFQITNTFFPFSLPSANTHEPTIDKDGDEHDYIILNFNDVDDIQTSVTLSSNQ